MLVDFSRRLEDEIDQLGSPQTKAIVMAKKLDEEVAKPKLTPEMFLECVQNIRRAKNVVDEATGAYRAQRKIAKDRGVDMPTLALMESLARLDEDEVRQRLSKLRLYMAWDGGGEQLNLFDSAPVEMPTERAMGEHSRAKAEQAGREWYKANGDLDDNPYSPGSPNHQAFVVGWRAGEAVTAGKLGENASVKRASSKRGLKKPEDAGMPPPSVSGGAEHATAH